MENFKEDQHIGLLFKQLNKEIVRILNKEFEAYGVTLMQNEVLCYIHYHGQKKNINQKDIERYFNSTNPTITGILNRLQSKGLISREMSTEDARYKVIKLTDEGQRMIGERLKDTPNRVDKRVTKYLKDEEREQLRYLLIKVLKGLKE